MMFNLSRGICKLSVLLDFPFAGPLAREIGFFFFAFTFVLVGISGTQTRMHNAKGTHYCVVP